MSKRPTITERMKIDALLDRADDFGSPICCGWCGNPLTPQTPIHWDHYTPLALGGEHTYQNLRPMHLSCHLQKTRGRGATTAGSDIAKISKVKRIVRTCKFQVNKRAPGSDKPASKWGSRKIKSRGFEKKHRPMNWRKAS